MPQLAVRKKPGYGWLPQLPDPRDAQLAIPPNPQLPSQVDLRGSKNMPSIYDQGQLGSCTGNAIAAAVDFDNCKQTGSFLTPSRLWIYYQERVIEGTVSSDSGGQIRDGMKAVAKLGVCPESDWPYDVSTFAQPPSQKDYSDALKDRALAYQSVTQDLFALKSTLYSGLPVVFGFTVYQPFESSQVAQTGIVPMPSPTDTVVGGHAVVLVGYNDAVDRFFVRNSWGAGWGEHGYFEMPYLYVTSASLASDFWVIQKTS